IASQKELRNVNEGLSIRDRLAFLPTVSVEAGSFKSTDPTASATAAAANLSLDANLNLFRFGGDLARYQAAGLRDTWYADLVQQSVLDIKEETSRTLFLAIETKLVVEARGKYFEVQSKAFEFSRARFDRGLQTPEEFKKISIDQANAK